MGGKQAGASDFDKALADLLSGYRRPVVAQAKKLMRAVESGHAELERKVNRGWCSISYRHRRAGYVCGVFLQGDRATLLFEHGRLLTDPEGVLEGDGTQVRFIPYPPSRAIDGAMIAAYLSEAISLRG